tara:strand:- start:1083 stop:2015 length:933 start_codon:yes stop_codon:yes gene_type:complete
MKSTYISQWQSFITCCFFLLISFKVLAQVGIGTIDPITQLDINGAISLREGPSLTLANGINNINSLGTTAFSQYRLIGPSVAFSIRNIAPLANANGQLITLINTTNAPLTILHEGGGIAVRRIYCPGESNLVLNGRYSTVTLQYNPSLMRWIVVDYTDIRYGDNIISVKGTTNISTNSNTFSDMSNMTLTFTPRHSTVYVNFSASGHMDGSGFLPEASYAQFRLVNVTASNSVQAGVTTLCTDYDYDDMTGEIVALAWNANIAMFPITVTPGQSTTLKIQWARDGVFPTALLNSVNTMPNSSHRSFTIFD